MNTFGKQERLCSRLLIERLHQEGHRMLVFPYSVRWLQVDQLPASLSAGRPEVQCLPADVQCQVLIVAPKRKLRHAVDRNRAKRLMRECYRLRKQSLYQALQEGHSKILLSLSYIHTEVLPFHQMQRRTDKLLHELIEAICSNESTN